MKTRILLFLIMTLIVLSSSCSRPKMKWAAQDYYSYSQGAYINGVEYHMVGYIVFGTNFVGFHHYNCDNLVGFHGCHWHGGLSSNPRGERQYSWEFLIITDTINFYKGACFSFFDNGGKLKDYLRIFTSVPYGEHYNGPQVVMATIYDLDKKTNYTAKEGRIIVNSTKINENDVDFDFVAENEDGERLVIEKGYIKGFIR